MSSVALLRPRQAGFGAVAAPTAVKLPPRGLSPYAGIAIPAFDPSQPNVPLTVWANFFKSLTGEAAARVAEGQAGYATLGEAIDRMLTGASLWTGFNTAPLPIPYADMVVPLGFFGGGKTATGAPVTTASPGGGGGGSSGQGGVRKQLNGLSGFAGTATATQTFPVPSPPPGYTGKGQDLGDGSIVLFGNTNGNPSPGMLAWLAYAIKSNGRVYASPAWVSSGAIQTWDAAFEPQTRLATQVADIAAVVLSAVGIGEAAGAIDGTAAGAGGGAGATTTASLSATDVGTVASTSEIAAPVTAVDTGLTASTIAPLSASGLTAAGVASGAGGAATLADAAGVGATALKAAGTVAAADALSKAAAGQPSTTASLAPGAPGATAAKPSGLTPLVIGGSLLALAIALFS